LGQVQKAVNALDDFTTREEVMEELEGATFYEVKNTVNEWFDREKEAGRLILVCSEGAHSFYKEA
jgi:hypothetical protein